MDFGGEANENLEERVRREHLEGLEQGNITGKAVRVSASTMIPIETYLMFNRFQGSSEDRMDVDGSEIDSAHKRKTSENDEVENAQAAAKKVKIVGPKVLL